MKEATLRENKQLPQTKKKKKKAVTPKEHLDASSVMFRHPIYGEIPLRREKSFKNSKPRHFFYFDPTFKPKLPKGGIRGDVKKQDYNPDCHVPKYFYIDVNFECPQCGEMFLLTAERQKYWYEERQVVFDSSEVRCSKCQKSKRETESLKKQLKIAEKNLFERPNDTNAMYAYAEMVAKYYERFLRSSERSEVQIALNRAKKACIRALEISQKNRKNIFQKAKNAKIKKGLTV